ncbi:carbonic anhydrase [bacterium]|nr:MAG: carbonic anhydrase [bacterium]
MAAPVLRAPSWAAGGRRAARLPRAGAGHTRFSAGLLANIAGMTDTPYTLRTLLEGNQRFINGTSRALSQAVQHAEHAAGQSPFAVVLGCADSRVPVEMIFDQEPGSLFVIRLAGNTASADAIASIEYAVAVLKSSLLLVLGHSSCGAATAAVEYVRSGVTLPGEMQRFVHAVAPAAERARTLGGDWVEQTVAENVRLTLAKLSAGSPIISQAVAQEGLSLAGALYDLLTGRVNVL